MPYPHAARRRRVAHLSRFIIAATGALLPGCGEPAQDAAPSPASAAAGLPAGSAATAGSDSASPIGVPGASGGEGMSPVTVPSGSLGAAADDSAGELGSAADAGDGGPTDAAPPASVPATCGLPSSFRWSSSPPLIAPSPPPGRSFASIKDPSIVFYEGKYHVFATVYETTAGAAGYKSVYLSFSDFSQAAQAQQVYMPDLPTGSTVAPQVFYFEPQNRWYLIYQWGARYSTNADIDNPAGWSAPQPLLAGEPTNALDFWVICDDTSCHLFFSRDDGVLYTSKTSIDNFPNFSGYDVVMSEPTPGLLFEASNVYKVDGSDQYLLLVEAYGPRYFRSWTAQSLDGPWLPLAATQQNPFAGAANVSFEGERWSDDISHGELIRSGHDQRLTIDACNLRYLYQGTAPGFQGEYNEIPYRLGLISAQ